jgi:hypothetical protein
MRIELHAPTCWKELTTEQLCYVVEMGLKGLRREKYLLVLFCHFAGMKMIATKGQSDEKKGVRAKFKYGDTVFSLEDWQVSEFCGRLAFVVEEPMPIDVQWPFKWNRHLLDTTFGSWFHADAMMLGFALEGDIERLKGAMKDLGDPHDDLKPDSPDFVLMLRWYDLFKGWLQERYPLVFRKADSSSGSDSASSPIETRQNIMLMLNDGHPQDNEAIENSNMHDVLAALQHKIEEAKRIEEQMRKYK